jgi:uncharacterized membrane protein
MAYTLIITYRINKMYENVHKEPYMKSVQKLVDQLMDGEISEEEYNKQKEELKNKN